MISAQAEAKAPMFDRVLQRLRAASGGDADACWWVPGRLEVFGTHTDYAGGRTLVAAVPRGFAVAMRRRSDAEIRVIDVARTDDFVVNLRVLPTRLSGWRRYVQTVVARLTRNFPGATLGATIAFESDLPRAAGMSSSSALMIAVVTALAEASDLRSRPEWRDNMPAGTLDEAAYYACIENGRTFRALSGDAGVGTHGGSEDHAAILTGLARTVSGYAFVPMRPLDTAPVPDDWAFIVASSGIRADKTGTAKNKYNRLSEGAAALLGLWTREHGPRPSLADALAASADDGVALERIARTRPTKGWTGAQLANRLTHFIHEDARIPAALQAFSETNAETMGRLAADSQREAEDLLRNQTPQTSALVRLARDNGSFAARSFGAGFGGSVWALVARADAAGFTPRWLDAYRREFPNCADAVTFEATPGPGLRKIK